MKNLKCLSILTTATIISSIALAPVSALASELNITPRAHITGGGGSSSNLKGQYKYYKNGLISYQNHHYLNGGTNLYLPSSLIAKMDKVGGNQLAVLGIIGLSKLNPISRMVLATIGKQWGKVLRADNGKGVTLLFSSTSVLPYKTLSGKKLTAR
ncbi:hypothetical protein K5V21_18920 [Clostridium sardiniense]|uniref:Uncharacterized protein n=1 Tax=Clostridium sardiniense TaxID=29369 RepID=A0ABS7L325_CLOSR|nr:hypothetical protein [Clostridium sardiniense]MBY0757475.1 hypothetical protein [Clostridium sardiniense]MDQ0462229.1 hypothetical protein [Clostridium sardiniense]